MNAISTTNLTKYYGSGRKKSRGIMDVTLSVPEGDFFGFIGPNGAGKSTTIRILLGLIAPSDGSAELLGKNILAHKQGILSEIGYLPSETNFYSGLRVRDILQLSADLRRQDCRAEAARLCERLELDASRRIDELSLGNRKKVGIVCALQHHPRLYILDEPTSGLDPLMQREFYTILKERNQDGATIFLSSHILSEIQRYCRHAAIIREGRLLVTSTVEQLGHTDAKRVTLYGISSLPPLEGITQPIAAKNQPETNSVSFLYSGSPKTLLSALSSLPFTDITITEPDLEEIFLHYYDDTSTTQSNI